MKRRSKKLAALFLAGIMTVSAALSGCGGKPGTDSSGESKEAPAQDENTGDTEVDGDKESLGAGESGGSAEGSGTKEYSPEEEVVISMWNKDAQQEGIQNTPLADEIARKTGVRLEVINGDAQKFKVLLAGGDLPDIVNSNYGDQGVDSKSLIKSGQLLQLDELLAEHAPGLADEFASAISYSKEFLSDDGNLYYLPIQKYMMNEDYQIIERTGTSVGFYTRYDLYKQLGSPQINTPDDYLEMLKAMQEANPSTETGEKTYAISGWSDWGLWMFTIPYQCNTGVTNWNYDMMYDLVNQEPLPTYYCDSFWEGLRFYNKAYNMGILDPEIFTQKYDNYVDKLKNGQTFVTYSNWLYDTANDHYVTEGKEDWGVELIPTGMNYLYGVYKGDEPFGWATDYPLSITKNCQYPEKVMELLEFLFSEEGARLLNSGVEGVHWEYVDGVPQMTDEYYEQLAADPNYKQIQGFSFAKLSGLSSSQVLSDGYPADLTKSNEEIAKLTRKIDWEFIEDSGVDATFPGQVLAARVEAGDYHTVTDVDLTPSLVKEPSDETKTMVGQVDEYMKVAIAQIVMASEDDFESEKEAAIEAIDAKGYDKVAEEMMELWLEAQRIAADFEY